jgi:S-adenosylmethionine decarboxylase
MPKTWPYIQKNRIRGFFASEKRTERRERVQALGRHLLLELFDCDAEALNSLETVKASMVEAAKRAQATIVDVVFHEFNPFGISGVVVIAESHLAIHTWPEYRFAAVDIFSCGDVLQPQTAANYLVEQFGAARTSVVELQRGIFLQAAPMPHKPAGARATGARVSGAKVPGARATGAKVPGAKVPVGG